jgi:gliding motility-associated-like protein
MKRSYFKHFLAVLSLFALINSTYGQMILSGTATGECDCYTLTTTGGQGGSVWSPSTIDLTKPFDFTFEVGLGDNDGGGADGMVFVLRQSGTSTGGIGSLLGYGGIDNSIGIEIDTWQSGADIAAGEIAADHLGMNSNGTLDHDLVAATAIDNIEDGLPHLFRVVWDPITTEMEVFLDGVSEFTYTGDLVTTIFGGDPNVYFGWTGATGGSFNLQTVCFKRFPDISLVPDLPCPGIETDLIDNSTSWLIYDGVPFTEYEWEFEDGLIVTDESTSYTFDAAGTYTVTLTVTDITGCSTTETFEIDVDELEPFMFGTDVTCFGAEDGTAGAIFLPAIPGLEFLWDDTDSQTTETATDLGPGTYNVIVTDPSGCTGTGTVTITEPDEIIIDEVISIDASCNASDGTIEISASGGNPPFDYSINGGISFSASSSFAGLEGGEYTIVVRDDNGCEVSTTVEINSSGLEVDLLVNEPTCYGFSDGSIVIISESTEEGITFEVTDSTGTILNIDNSNATNSLGSGWYYILVDDGTDCIFEDSVFIDQPGQIDINLQVTDPLCFGENSGYAVVQSVTNAVGTQDEISYIWNLNPAGNNGIGADSTWFLSAGDYTLTINDLNGCSRSFNFNVDQPDSLVFSELGYDPAYCRLYDYQNGNGVVFAALSGGTPDFSYSWTYLETGATTTNSTWGGRNPGTYEIIGTDDNGCEISALIEVDSLNPKSDFKMTSDQFTSNYVGTAPIDVHFVNLSTNFANPNNPTADTSFFWNFNHDEAPWVFSDDIAEEFDTTYTAQGNTYTVEVCLTASNKNGCSDTKCRLIEIYEPIRFENVNVFTPNGDGANDVFTFEFKSSSIAEFNCVIVNRWGVKVAELNDVTDFWDGNDLNGTMCKNGVYFYNYEATTDNGTALNGQGKIQLVGTQP